MADTKEALEAEIAKDELALNAIKSEAAEESSIQLRHPLTGDVISVKDDPNQLIPWMAKGYRQVHIKGVK